MTRGPEVAGPPEPSGRLAARPALLAALLWAGCASAPSAAKEGYARVNGIRMYYEIHGEEQGVHGADRGVPLVLIPGGGSTIEVTFGRVLGRLARHRPVIAVEEQGHGRTSDRDAPFRFETSADDVAALVRSLGHEKVDLFGFSNGASTALQVAIRHPEVVGKLVFASAMTRKDGARPELWEFMRHAEFSNMPRPLKDAFLRVNPDERQLRTMHEKDVERMSSFRDVPEADLEAVRAPTLIVIGDEDVVKPEHAVELSRLIPNARLLVLPAGHGDYIGELVATTSATRLPELTVGIVEEFLDGGAR